MGSRSVKDERTMSYALMIPWDNRSPLQIYRMPEFPDKNDFPLYNADRRR